MTIFDAPGGSSVVPLARAVFQSGIGATSVVFTAHFEVYLIQNDAATYRVSWSASTTFTLSGTTMTVGAIGYTVGASGDVSGLPANLRSILHSSYSSYTHIQ